MLTTSMIGQRLLLKSYIQKITTRYAVAHSGYINKHVFSIYYVRDTARKYTQACKKRNKTLKNYNFK